MMNNWIISSSILIAAVLAARFLLRGRISLRLQYALWAVVLVRLLIPFQIFLSPISTVAVSERVDLSAPVREVYFTANEDQYERQYDAAYRDTIQWHESRGKQLDPVEAEQQAAEAARLSLELELRMTLYGIWFAGMAVMGIVIIACNLHLSTRLRRHRWALEEPDSLLPVYITEVVPTPCLFGLFRPAVYLTPEAARDDSVRSHVLAHELTHYQHFDHVWSVLRSLCLVLHWYNPLVWIAAKVSRADAELACDEGALAKLGEEQRGDYGRTLIGLTCADRAGSVFLTATTMTGSAGSIRERIRLLMKRPKTTALTLTAVVVLVTLFVGCTFADTPGTTEPPQPTDATLDLGDLDLDPDDIIHTTPVSPTYGVDNDMSYDGQELPIPDTMTSTDLLYALPMEQAMADYADRNPRELTESELKRFRDAFRTMDAAGNVNPAACFLASYYEDITQMDGGEFLAYFPTAQDGTEEEFELLKEKYPDYFADWTWETMPLPIHRYDPAEIDAVLSRFSEVRWAYLNEGVHYLEETGCYYNYTSDFGLGGFYARSGFVYDGGAVIYSGSSALFFTKKQDRYFIQAHLPLIG